MVVTGYSDMQAIINAINKGHTYYYITKPWTGSELKLILANALEAYSLRQQTRELEKQNVVAQFEILKNQINPHFLFNCINVLSSLIKTNPEEAFLFNTQFGKTIPFYFTIAGTFNYQFGRRTGICRSLY